MNEDIKIFQRTYHHRNCDCCGYESLISFQATINVFKQFIGKENIKSIKFNDNYTVCEVKYSYDGPWEKQINEPSFKNLKNRIFRNYICDKCKRKFKKGGVNYYSGKAKYEEEYLTLFYLTLCNSCKKDKI